MLEEIKGKIKYLSLGELLDLSDFVMACNIKRIKQRKKEIGDRLVKYEEGRF